MTARVVDLIYQVRSLLRLAVVAALALAAPAATAQLTLEGVVYHEATQTSYATSPIDNGGAAFVMFRNNTGATQSFANAAATINGQPASGYSQYDWSRVWPLSVPPGEVATLTLKGNGGVFAPGQNVNLGLTSDAGVSLAVNSVPLSTPKLRVASVVPTRDLTKVNVYLRNDDDSAYLIDELHLNDDVTAQSRFIGGNSMIAPGAVKIVEVDFGAPQDLLTPYAVRVEAIRSNDSQAVTTGAPVRLTEPILPVGSWQADLATQQSVMRDARIQYGHELHGATSRFPGLMETRLDNYSIRGLHIDILDFPGGNLDVVEYRDFSTGVPGGVPHQAPLFELPGPVADQADNPAIYGWYVRDEPDLNTSSPTRNPQAMWRLNDTFWRNSDKPTFLNLVADGSVQRYGLISDHPAIDRYLQEAPLSDSRGNRNIDQVLQYADSMKNNVEPLRMWWITQGISDAWGGDQPTDWGIDVQFWSALMGGAKGMIGFMFDNRENTHPAQFARQQDVIHELQTVRNLVLYGEPLANTTLRVGGSIVDQSAEDITAAARSIISEHAVVLPVANLTGRQSFFSGPTFDVLSDVTVDVEIPDWIDVAQVKRVTADGFQDLAGDFSYAQNGQQISISIDALNDTDVFLISEADAEAPQQVNNLRLVDGSFLSWDEPWDNFGVHGYQVLRNSQVIGLTPTPMFELPSFNPDNLYQIRAFDASLNYAAPSIGLGQEVSQWDGANPGAGAPGDGVSWGDAANWTTAGVVDAPFAPGTIVLFAGGLPPSTIQLQANRTATALNFQGSFVLDGFTLTVNNGDVTVEPGVEAEIRSSLATPAGEWNKSGQGTLHYNGSLADDLVIAEGVYAGTSSNQGIEVMAGAVLAPGDPSGFLRTNANSVFRTGSKLLVTIPSNGQAPGLLAFGHLNINAGVELEIALDGYVPELGFERRLVTVLGSSDLVGMFEPTFPEIDEDLAWELVQDPVADAIDLRIISSADFNSDGQVDEVDAGAWRSGYGMLNGAQRSDGDANGDHRVDGKDFLLLQRQFGTVTPTVQAVPEAATLPLSIFIAALAWRRGVLIRHDDPAARAL